jgi:hypothetical protein
MVPVFVLDKMMAMKDEAIIKLERAKDETINKLERAIEWTIEAKDETIIKLERVIEETIKAKDETIIKLERTIDGTIKTKDETIKAKDETIIKLERAKDEAIIQVNARARSEHFHYLERVGDLNARSLIDKLEFEFKASLDLLHKNITRTELWMNVLKRAEHRSLFVCIQSKVSSRAKDVDAAAQLISKLYGSLSDRLHAVGFDGTEILIHEGRVGSEGTRLLSCLLDHIKQPYRVSVSSDEAIEHSMQGGQ